MIDFTLFGCGISLSPLFVMRLTAILLIDKTGQAGVILLCSLFHELGHLIFMIILGFPPKSIALLPLSADIKMSEKLLPLKAELAIHMGGILTNFAVSSVFILAFFVWRNDTFLLFFAANLIIALFNLTPISGLDGGNFLFALLCAFAPTAADGVCRAISFFFGLGLFFSAVFLTLRFKNPALLLFCIYIGFMSVGFNLKK